MFYQLLIFTLFAYVASASNRDKSIESRLDNLWSSYMQRYGKNYTDLSEESRHKETFAQAMIDVALHNLEADLGLHSYRKGINQFSDIDEEEFNAMYPPFDTEGMTMNGIKVATRWHRHSVKPTRIYKRQNLENLPDSVDWRGKLVTPVKSQGGCGACYAFSTIGALEGAYAKKTGELISLSVQQAVDCGGAFNKEIGGCRGGGNPPAYAYYAKYGIMKDSDYGFEQKQGECRYDPKKKVDLNIKGYILITEEDRADEEAIKEIVATRGPVSIGIHFNKLGGYKGGIFDEPCEGGRNHAVLIVGYGSEDGKDYWIVKNQWSEGWGEEGYFRIARGKNLCNMATDAQYPDLA